MTIAMNWSHCTRLSSHRAPSVLIRAELLLELRQLKRHSPRPPRNLSHCCYCFVLTCTCTIGANDRAIPKATAMCYNSYILNIALCWCSSGVAVNSPPYTATALYKRIRAGQDMGRGNENCCGYYSVFCTQQNKQTLNANEIENRLRHSCIRVKDQARNILPHTQYHMMGECGALGSGNQKGSEGCLLILIIVYGADQWGVRIDLWWVQWDLHCSMMRNGLYKIQLGEVQVAPWQWIDIILEGSAALLPIFVESSGILVSLKSLFD